jgi:hypothetical protein
MVCLLPGWVIGGAPYENGNDAACQVKDRHRFPRKVSAAASVCVINYSPSIPCNQLELEPRALPNKGIQAIQSAGLGFSNADIPRASHPDLLAIHLRFHLAGAMNMFPARVQAGPIPTLRLKELSGLPLLSAPLMALFFVAYRF